MSEYLGRDRGETATGYSGAVRRIESAYDSLARQRSQDYAVNPPSSISPWGGTGLAGGPATQPQPAYSFPSGIDPNYVTPDLGRPLTFSDLWNNRLQTIGSTPLGKDLQTVAPSFVNQPLAPWNLLGGGSGGSGGSELDDKRIQFGSPIDEGPGADMQWFREAMQRYSQEQWEPFSAEIGDVRDRYGSMIDKLKDELAGYGTGIDNANAAYASYQLDSGAALEGAIVDADPLPESAVVEEVGKIWDHYDGEMAATLERIDANGDPALAEAMGQEVRHMEVILTDGLRSGLLTQDEMHGLASAQARSLANMAHKDNAYQAEKARWELELQIKGAMMDKEDEIDAAKAAMEDAIKQVRDRFNDIEMDPSEVWNRAMADYFKRNGLNDLEAQDMSDLFDHIMSNNPDAFSNYGAFREEILWEINSDLVAKFGLTEQLNAGIKMEQEADIAAGGTGNSNLLNMMMNIDDPMKLYNLFSLNGALEFGPVNAEDLQAAINVNEDKYQSLFDLWEYHQDFTTNYDAHTQVDPTLFPDSLSFNADGTYAYPVAGENWWSGGGYGTKKNDGTGRSHEGVDIHARMNTPIVAATGGTVTRITTPETNSMGGYTVTVTDEDGYKHYYAHMIGPTGMVMGQTISPGTIIGGVGGSGNANEGRPHLHYGIKDGNGNPINPTQTLRGVNTAVGTKVPDFNGGYWVAPDPDPYVIPTYSGGGGHQQYT